MINLSHLPTLLQPVYICAHTHTQAQGVNEGEILAQEFLAQLHQMPPQVQGYYLAEELSYSVCVCVCFLSLIGNLMQIADSLRKELELKTCFSGVHFKKNNKQTQKPCWIAENCFSGINLQTHPPFLRKNYFSAV